MPIQKWSDRIWVIELGDEPALSDDLTAARREAERAEPVPDLVLDLSRVDHVNSSNLSQLLRLRKMAVDAESSITLAGPNNAVWAVFMSTGLEKVFGFAPNVAVALAGMQMQQSEDEGT
jgi:anti-anti-sigma factor